MVEIHPVSFPFLASLLVSSALAVCAALQLAVPACADRIRLSLQCPLGLLQTAGVIQIAAALFLLFPETRIWGIAAATGLIAAGVVIFLHSGRPLWCLPALVMLACLAIVAFAA